MKRAFMPALVVVVGCVSAAPAQWGRLFTPRIRPTIPAPRYVAPPVVVHTPSGVVYRPDPSVPASSDTPPEPTRPEGPSWWARNRTAGDLIVCIIIVTPLVLLYLLSRSPKLPVDEAAKLTGRVRITAVPPGEAPEWVRQAWVGVEMPTTSKSPFAVLAFQLVSGTPVQEKGGFAVPALDAVRALELVNLAAAEWWRTNLPDVRVPGFQFVFPAEVCERLG